MTDTTETGPRKNGILIIEDDSATREYLCEVANNINRVTVLDDVGTVADALRALKQTAPELVLCDLGLPDGDGTEVIRQCVTLDIPAMVISVFDDEATVLRAIEAGAVGYLLKDQGSDVLRQAITDLLAGGSPLTPSIARFLLKRLGAAEENATAVTGSGGKSSGSDGDHGLLSDREKEVLGLLAHGYKTKEVAGKLGLSHHTIASHQRNVYAKLMVKNKSEAVAVAIKKGLIDL